MSNKAKNLKQYAWIFSGIGTAIIVALYEFFKSSQTGILAPIAIGSVIILIYIALSQIVSFLKRKDFFSYFKAKIKELLYLILEDKKTYIESSDKFNVFVLHEKMLVLTDSINRFICFNQGVYANYSFMAGRYHKKMKEEFIKDAKDMDALKGYCLDLKNHLHNKFVNVCEENYRKHIKRYFEGRSKHDVRMTVKGCSRDGKMVDMFRLHYEYLTNYSPEENSGFLHVRDRGSYFLCNNIPQNASDDKYFNPRLMNDRVRKYLQDLEEYNKQEDLDRWIDCWIPNRKGDEIIKPTTDSCYKSTLIIPITLMNNEGLSDEFRNHFKIPVAPRSSDKISRAVYGLLCFDHRNVDFFIEDIDVKVGYIYADILSLYLVDLLNYMDYSDTFNATKDLYPDIKEMFA